MVTQQARNWRSSPIWAGICLKVRAGKVKKKKAEKQDERGVGEGWRYLREQNDRALRKGEGDGHDK